MIEHGRSETEPTSQRLPGVVVLMLFVGLIVYLASPVGQNGDARNAGPTAASIVTEFNLDIDEFEDLAWYGEYQTVFDDGRGYDYFPWTRSVVAVPVALGVEVASWVGIGDGAAAVPRSSRWEPLLLTVPAAITAAVTCAVLCLMAFEETRKRGRRIATLTAAFVGFGTLLATGFWSTASRGLFHHGPAALWTAIAVWATARIRRGEGTAASPWIAGACAAAAAFTRPTVVFTSIAVLVWFLIAARPFAAKAIAGAAAVGLVITLVNIVTFGSLMMPYYDITRTGRDRPDPALWGLAGSLVSPSRGLLVFMPALVLGGAVGLWLSARHANGRDRSLDLMLATGAAAVLLIGGLSPEGWWMGHSYGNRFGVDVIVVLAFLAIPAVAAAVDEPRSALAMGLLVTSAWSVFVHAQGALIKETACFNVVPTNVDDDRDRLWSISDPQFLTGVRWLADGNSPLSTSCGSFVSDP